MLAGDRSVEHAYYFDHHNRRREYLDALIDRRLDWDFAAARYRLAFEQSANVRRESSDGHLTERRTSERSRIQRI
jgi:hypothetical protein